MTVHFQALRALIVVATLGTIGAALVAPEAASRPLSWLVAAGALACALGAAALPDSHWPTGTLLLLLVHWLLVVDGSLSVMTPIAAAGIVIVHVLASIASTTPTGARPDRATYRRWARRSLALIGIATVLWLAAVGADRTEHSGEVLLVLVFGLLAGAGVWAIRVRVLSSPDV